MLSLLDLEKPSTLRARKKITTFSYQKRKKNPFFEELIFPIVWVIEKPGY